MIRDRDHWEKKCGSGYDYSYTYYRSPEYSNDKYESYYFKIEGGWVSCIFYDSNKEDWRPSIFTSKNIFSYKVRRFIKEKKRLKKYIKDIERRKREDELTEAIGDKLRHKKSPEITNFISPPPRY